jgi:maleate cis-trans isomerase
MKASVKDLELQLKIRKIEESTPDPIEKEEKIQEVLQESGKEIAKQIILNLEESAEQHGFTEDKIYKALTILIQSYEDAMTQTKGVLAELYKFANSDPRFKSKVN